MSGWDESRHPRVPGGGVNGGQFTEKEMETAVGAATKAAGVGASELDRNLMEAARQISDLPQERALIFDPKTGEPAYWTDPETGEVSLYLQGDEHSVNVTTAEHDQMKGKVVMHNHPGGNPTFSSQDLVTARRLKTPLEVLVAGDWLIKAHQPKGGWPVIDREFIFKHDLRMIGALTTSFRLEDLEKVRYTGAVSEELTKVLTYAYKNCGIEVTYERIR